MEGNKLVWEIFWRYNQENEFSESTKGIDKFRIIYAIAEC